MATYDFWTLYINIPYNKLKNEMRELINFCFNVGGKYFIAVTKFCATWPDDKNISKITFDKVYLKLTINFLLYSCFFNISNLSFQQIIEIRISSDPAPFIANVFLYYYENK